MDGENEVSLPKATLLKMIKDFTPGDMRVASDTVEMMMECCTEFIQLMSSEANEFATKEGKNTIQPEHVVKALQELGFEDFMDEINLTWGQYKEDAKTTSSQKASLRKTGADQAGLSEAQQIALQQQMFAAARARSMTSADNAAAMAAAYQAQLAAYGSQVSQPSSLQHYPSGSLPPSQPKAAYSQQDAGAAAAAAHRGSTPSTEPASLALPAPAAGASSQHT